VEKRSGGERRNGRDRRRGDRREEDEREALRDRIRESRWTPYVLTLALVIFGFWRFDVVVDAQRDQGDQLEDQNARLISIVRELKREAAQREDGQCRIFEADQLAEVEELRDTYAYLAEAQRLGPAARDAQLYRFALARLPETEAKAAEDQAPAYCDDLDDRGREIGLPEPDPVVPTRPPALKNSLP
jgi:hypothetical protein